MAKVERSYVELLTLVQALNSLLSNKDFVQQEKKGVKKLQKVAEKLKSHLDSYNEQLEEIRLDHAHTDKDGSLLLDENGKYKYSKDGLKALNKSVKELMEKTFEFYQFTFSHEGIENYGFLEGWVEGLNFPKEEVEEDEAEVIEMKSE